MQQSTNIYQKARESAGFTQERAAELIGVSITSIKEYEGDRRKPPDHVVGQMIDIYHSPHLAVQHIRAASQIGCALIPEMDEKELAAAALNFFDAIPDLEGIRTRLIKMAKDNTIDTTERPIFDADMEMLGALVKSYYELKFHKHGKEG